MIFSVNAALLEAGPGPACPDQRQDRKDKPQSTQPGRQRDFPFLLEQVKNMAVGVKQHNNGSCGKSRPVPVPIDQPEEQEEQARLP